MGSRPMCIAGINPDYSSLCQDDVMHLFDYLEQDSDRYLVHFTSSGVLQRGKNN